MKEDIPRVPVPVNYGDIITEIQMVQIEVDEIVGKIKSMPENGKMVEWGSGGSTCKWLDSITSLQKLISIEHNENWYNRVSRAVKKHFGEPSNFQYLHIPEQYGFEHGYATVTEEHPLGLGPYINPDADIWDADNYLIDGIARATCAMMVLLKNTNPNAIVYMHDHEGREIWYDWATQFYNIEQLDLTLARLHFK